MGIITLYLYIHKTSLGKANLFGIKGIQITILLP